MNATARTPDSSGSDGGATCLKIAHSITSPIYTAAVRSTAHTVTNASTSPAPRILNQNRRIQSASSSGASARARRVMPPRPSGAFAPLPAPLRLRSRRLAQSAHGAVLEQRCRPPPPAALPAGDCASRGCGSVPSQARAQTHSPETTKLIFCAIMPPSQARGAFLTQNMEFRAVPPMAGARRTGAAFLLRDRGHFTPLRRRALYSWLRAPAPGDSAPAARSLPRSRLPIVAAPSGGVKGKVNAERP